MRQISILYIGKSVDDISALTAHHGVLLTHIGEAKAAAAYLKAGNKPNAILCELNIDGGNAFEIHDFLRNNLFREDQKYKHVSFILLCNEFHEEIYKRAWNKENRRSKQAIDEFYLLPLTNIDNLLTRINELINLSLIHISEPTRPY